MFKNYCIAQGLRPRKFGLDMDVRWNSTYLMLKHLLPYKEVFHVWLNSNYGCELLTLQHWHVAEQIMIFLEIFYDCTVVLSGVYYPTAPLVLHHILEIAEHLQTAEKDQNFRAIAYPMKHKFLKYWEKIPLIYSYAFILDPRAKMKGFYNVLELLGKALGTNYSLYYGEVKNELYRLFAKYEEKFGAARSQRVAVPSAHTGKRKQAWGRIFGGPGASSTCSPSSSAAPSVVIESELKSYLVADPVTCYEETFDILCWWRDHKLTYPVLSIMVRDIMSVPVSTVSSESCFSCTSRISKTGDGACYLSMWRCLPASRTGNWELEGNNIHLRTVIWRRHSRTSSWMIKAPPKAMAAAPAVAVLLLVARRRTGD